MIRRMTSDPHRVLRAHPGATGGYGGPTDRVPYEPRAIGTRITRREGALIVAFWMLLALITVANRMFGPGGILPLGMLLSPYNQLAVAESLLWIVLTPAIFWMAARFPLDRHDHRVLHLAIYAVGALVVLLIVSVAGDAMRDFFLPPRPAREGSVQPPWWNLLGRWWLLNDLIRFMGVLAAGLARSYSLRYRARQQQAVLLQAQLAQARLDVLRSQLDPHFLFNTLHAISSLVERDPRGVRRMISRLSELLRHSMDGSAQPEIPLREELELLGRYLDIIQVRFQGQLEIEQRVTPRALGAMVPNLILQPLAENAVKHGIGQLTGKGQLLIEALVEGPDGPHPELVLRVTDNGPGLAAQPSPGALPTAPGTGSGLGLRNTRARLEQLYGSKQSFTLGPRTGEQGGTVAEVRIPFHTHSVAMMGLPMPAEPWDVAGPVAHAG